MVKKLKIRTLSNWSFVITWLLALLCIAACVFGFQKYEALRGASQDYIACEAAAHELQKGSDMLTKQVRLAASTGQQQYIDAYFEEADVTRSREKAVDELAALHDDPAAVQPLQQALAASMELMQTEYYSMRLVEEATHAERSEWPEKIRNVVLSAEDAALPDAEKMDRAQKMLIGTEYEGAKDEIAGDVDEALAVLTNEIMARQHRAADVFVRMLRTIIVCVVIFAVMMLLASLVIRRGVIRPLLEYNENIRHGLISPVHGVQELQTLAETYNSIYAENEEREMLMKHQAEHDPLTELLNRRSFDRILDLYTKDKNSFALILSDVDTFKSVNDTYGHDVGDVILKKAASLQQSTFRSVDYVCRIGGDEFAVIMVDMTRELYYTITDKIAEINRQLAICEEGLPAVSLSAGVAFSDENGQKESLFKAADHALYYTKKHGRSGCNVSPVA